MQPMLRHHGGVLTAMEELWAQQGCLTPQGSQSMRAAHRLASKRRSVSATPPSALPRQNSATNTVSAAPERTSAGAASSAQAAEPAAAAAPACSTPFGQRASSAAVARQQPTHAPHVRPPRIADGLVSRVAPVMTIRGLEISSDVARRAQLGDLGWETSSLLNLTHLNTAFSYIAQLVVFLSVVLDTPLPYHVVLGGSHCSVLQLVPASAVHSHLHRDIFEVRCCNSALPAGVTQCGCL